MKNTIMKNLFLLSISFLIGCEPAKIREVQVFDHKAKVPITHKFDTVTIQAYKVGRSAHFIYQLDNGLFIETSRKFKPGQQLSLQPLKNNEHEKDSSRHSN